MDRKDKKEKPSKRINRFIIECMFNKYFEEEKEIASVASLPRNDDRIAVKSVAE